MAMIHLLRHGESIWNVQNRFTGWVDVPLTEKGMQEAEHAGTVLRTMQLDHVCCSDLLRAQETAMIVMRAHASTLSPQRVRSWDACHDASMIPLLVDARFNERHYGLLQGLNKQETIVKHGAAQVKAWRRSFATRPPEGESLEDVCQRTHAAFDAQILPLLMQGKHVLLVAHGNTIRSLMMKLEKLAPDEIDGVECATGAIISYTFQHQNFTKC